MKDIYPMWKMCFVFRMREGSRNSDHVRDELKRKGLGGNELEDQIIIERSKAKKYGIPKGDATGAYIFHYYPELRGDGKTDTVSPSKTRGKNPGVLDEAENALNNCIVSGFIREEGDRVFLEKGRMFASPPCWHNPFSSNKEEKWNLYLIIEYIKAIGPFWGAIAFMITTILAYYLGTLQ